MLIITVIVTLKLIGDTFVLFSHASLGYDKMLHFLGGSACGIFGVGIIVSGGFYIATGIGDPSPTFQDHAAQVWISAIFWVLAIGIGWEILQAYFPFMRDASDYDWYDTVGDVVFDTLGGIAAAFIYHLKN
ncbi:MAG: hypothetical protein A3C13_04955 [Candidatus Lloydbacteria bacterium RIFCSPHIGHO2_02_FULL_50_11]|nr:MAG: hypothetical protein A3C13_04955 [Candidatus Lloydbacteria bacterium RIFCSPHIGHO2_02_FULL_50_11]